MAGRRLSKKSYEVFAQAVAAGKPIAAAYIQAGYRSRTPATTAHQLLNRPEVAARIEELKGGKPSPRAGTISGVNRVWLAIRYCQLLAAARESQNFKLAIECIEKIAVLVQQEEDEAAPTTEPQRIDLSTLSDKLGGVVDAAKAPDYSRPTMRALAAADNET